MTTQQHLDATRTLYEESPRLFLAYCKKLDGLTLLHFDAAWRAERNADFTLKTVNKATKSAEPPAYIASYSALGYTPVDRSVPLWCMDIHIVKQLAFEMAYEKSFNQADGWDYDKTDKTWKPLPGASGKLKNKRLPTYERELARLMRRRDAELQDIEQEQEQEAKKQARKARAEQRRAERKS